VIETQVKSITLITSGHEDL